LIEFPKSREEIDATSDYFFIGIAKKGCLIPVTATLISRLCHYCSSIYCHMQKKIEGTRKRSHENFNLVLSFLLFATDHRFTMNKAKNNTEDRDGSEA